VCVFCTSEFIFTTTTHYELKKKEKKLDKDEKKKKKNTMNGKENNFNIQGSSPYCSQRKMKIRRESRGEEREGDEGE
jgi:hypothetical protein